MQLRMQAEGGDAAVPWKDGPVAEAPRIVLDDLYMGYSHVECAIA